jgi:hypothetical protein
VLWTVGNVGCILEAHIAESFMRKHLRRIKDKFNSALKSAIMGENVELFIGT